MNVNVRFFIFTSIEKYIIDGYCFDEDIYPWYDACRESKNPLYIKNCTTTVITFQETVFIMTAVPFMITSGGTAWYGRGSTNSTYDIESRLSSSVSSGIGVRVFVARSSHDECSR